MAGIATSIGMLVRHEVRQEWRQRYALSGLLLYVVSTVFVTYLAFRQAIDADTWVALFWIIMLFASVNAVGKSFAQEPAGRLLYLYTLVPPQALIIARLIYNAGLLTLLGTLCYTVFAVLLGSPFENTAVFLLGMLLGCAGLAGTMTLISAIASKSANNATLTAILGFPLILPVLLTVIRFSQNALATNALESNLKYGAVLLLLNVIVITLSYILFPYLWRE